MPGVGLPGGRWSDLDTLGLRGGFQGPVELLGREVVGAVEFVFRLRGLDLGVATDAEQDKVQYEEDAGPAGRVMRHSGTLWD